MLGSAPDGTVAAGIGRTPSAVASRRVIRGTPAYPGGVRYRTEGEIGLLGPNDDEVIAAKLGRSANAVMRKRQVLGVPVLQYAEPVR